MAAYAWLAEGSTNRWTLVTATSPLHPRRARLNKPPRRSRDMHVTFLVKSALTRRRSNCRVNRSRARRRCSPASNRLHTWYGSRKACGVTPSAGSIRIGVSYRASDGPALSGHTRTPHRETSYHLNGRAGRDAERHEPFDANRRHAPRCDTTPRAPAASDESGRSRLELDAKSMEDIVQSTSGEERNRCDDGEERAVAVRSPVLSPSSGNSQCTGRTASSPSVRQQPARPTADRVAPSGTDPPRRSRVAGNP